MTSADPSISQLSAGLVLLGGTVLAVLASTAGKDPLTGIILLGGSILLAWAVATRGERWSSTVSCCRMRRR